MKTLNVSVSSLKARLSEYLRMVRKGVSLIVVDHNHPVAKVGPIQNEESNDLICVRPTENPSLKGFFAHRTVKRKFSSLEALLEDRRKR